MKKFEAKNNMDFIFDVVFYEAAAPERKWVPWTAFYGYRSNFVNELQGLDNPSFSHIESNVLLISSSKGNRIIVEFLPYVSK